MSGSLIAPCSLTKMMFTGEEDRAKGSVIDYPEPLAPRISEYKTAYQYLQLTILEGEPTNLKKIGRRFEKLEKEFDRLLEVCLKKMESSYDEPTC